MATAKKKETVKRTRRPWTPTSLYKNLTAYLEAEGIKTDVSIDSVLVALKESIVETSIS